MSHRFSYIKYNERAASKQAEFKKLFEAIESFADISLPDGRPKAILMTKLEEAYMWVGKAIRDEQEEPKIEQPERSNI